jgi:hypothetical protein
MEDAIMNFSLFSLGFGRHQRVVDLRQRLEEPLACVLQSAKQIDYSPNGQADALSQPSAKQMAKGLALAVLGFVAHLTADTGQGFFIMAHFYPRLGPLSPSHTRR